MFVDTVRIFVQGGDGGHGAVAWRREKYVPSGGPAGGDGGRGGSVILQADEGLATLIDFTYRPRYQAQAGQRGQRARRHGKDADDFIIKVPVGTQVYDDDGQILADLTQHGQRWVAARGGYGGRGNARFVTSTRQAPAFAEQGEAGDKRWLRLELKLLADVGLVGYPNVGKSTLISVVSAAKPKVADYPFTTLTPNLGVVSMGPGHSFVIADIPGIIEGAHEGVGLGHDFLRHIERTSVLVHVVDASGREGRHPVDDLRIITNELEQYRTNLLQRPHIIAANMIDLPDTEQYMDDIKQYGEQHDVPVYPISAITQQGVKELLRAVWNKVQEQKEIAVKERAEEPVVYDETKRVAAEKTRGPGIEEFTVEQHDGEFVVIGEGLYRYLQRLDLKNEAAIEYLQGLFRDIGVYNALRQAGAQDGDIVRIAELEFEFIN